jgi:hypothetical protein
MRKKIWMTAGDIVLVALREYEKDKCDIILKYTQDEIMKLKKAKEIPESLKVNEESNPKDKEGLIEFERRNEEEVDEGEESDDGLEGMYSGSDEEEEEEDEKEEKKEVKKKEVKKEEKKKEEVKGEEKHESEEEEETEDLSKFEQNHDILNDFCKQEKKVPSILSKTSHMASQNVKPQANTSNNYNKPTQNTGNKNTNANTKSNAGGKKKFVEVDLKNI